VRIFLLLVFLKLELSDPFIREIQPEEAWLYSYPHTDSYVPAAALWFLVLAVPTAAIGATFMMTRDWIDMREASLSVSLGLLLNGVVTDCIKLAVGRPRPDFMARCHPDGGGRLPPCTGSARDVMQGRKSFPSGHASFSCCLAVFVTLYLAGKLGTFTERGRRQSYKLLVLLPLLVAVLIAASRTCDYHHHWQDVLAGGALGAVWAWVAYHHFYPSVTAVLSERPLCVAGVDGQAAVQPQPDVEQAAVSDVKWM